MNRPTALLFDLDGTLVDSAVMIAAALTKLSAARGGAPADLVRTRRLVSRGAPVLVRETLGPAAGDSAKDVFAFRAILASIPAEPGIIFPGVVAALESLADQVPCAIVTNKPEGLARLLLDQLDLARFFGAVVGGDSLPVCKPDPEPLHHALRQILPGGAAAMIGDSEVDARAAGAAGMPFLLYRQGYEADGCSASIVTAAFDEFAELPLLLESSGSVQHGPALRVGGVI